MSADAAGSELESTVAAVIWCPFASEDEATAVLENMLEEGLIACGNILPGVTSVFLWEGQCQTSREVGVLMKTTAHLLSRAIERVAALHSYEAPAVVGWRCDGTAPATLGWLVETLPRRSI